MLFFKSEISFRNPYFDDLFNYFKSNSVFETYIDLYLVAVSIGVKLDKWVEDASYSSNDAEFRSLPRNVINNPDYKKQIEFIYENAVLKTKKLDISDDIRLLTAFDPTHELSAIENVGKFLNGYANYGFEVLNRLDKTKMFTLDCFQDLIDLVDDVKNDTLIDDNDIENIFDESIED